MMTFSESESGSSVAIVLETGPNTRSLSSRRKLLYYQTRIGTARELGLWRSAYDVEVIFISGR